MTDQLIIPNPGSDEARQEGCTCPHRTTEMIEGMSFDGISGFWITLGCPLHAPDKDKS
jgi:hypothetical protein